MITLITPTGGRPEAFALCEKYMARQSVKFDQWLVIDDYPVPTECTMGQEVIRPEPLWKDGGMTLPRNLLAGLQAAEGEYILIIEDDDWYSPEYIKTLVEKLQTYDLAGEGKARYYNIQNYRHMTHTNMKHASLCQTGFRRSILQKVMHCVEGNTGRGFIDLFIWELEVNKMVFAGSQTCLGIKGMPGRSGIGYGHTDRMGAPDRRPLHTLKKWIGPEAIVYEQFKTKLGDTSDRAQPNAG